MKRLLLLSTVLLTPVFADADTDKEDEKNTYCVNEEIKEDAVFTKQTPLNPKHICEQPKKPS